MTRYVFTGPACLSLDDEARLLWEVARLHDGAEFTTGGAEGTDTEAALAAALFYPDAIHRVVVPAAPWSEVAPEGAEVVLAPAGRDPYRLRNGRMLDFGDELVALLRSPRFYRSGEYMTVNLARSRGIRVRPVILGAAR